MSTRVKSFHNDTGEVYDPSATTQPSIHVHRTDSRFSCTPHRPTISPWSCYIISPLKAPNICLGLYFNRHFTLFVFCLFKAAPMAYGSFQARVLIRATVARLGHSHINARSEVRLQPIPQVTAMPDP